MCGNIDIKTAHSSSLSHEDSAPQDAESPRHGQSCSSTANSTPAAYLAVTICIVGVSGKRSDHLLQRNTISSLLWHHSLRASTAMVPPLGRALVHTE